MTLKTLLRTILITFFLMTNLSAQKAAEPPFNKGYLQVSDLHSIYYEQYGNSEGCPVIVLHGGPGFGCVAEYASFFDPDFYHIILLDQRGASRSLPFNEMEENTTDNLVSDLEVLRQHLNIEKWLLFGGSWGSTLALAYGEAHPTACLGFILRGIFLGRPEDAQHLVYGMKKVYPEVWQDFAELIPEDERHDLLQAYNKRIMDPNPATHLPAARSFMRYDLHCAVLSPDSDQIEQMLKDDPTMIGVARTFCHYASENFFLEDNQLLRDLDKIKHLPAIIVHGRYDVICPPENAYLLHKHWPKSELYFIGQAGHSAKEKPIFDRLCQATEEFKSKMAL